MSLGGLLAQATLGGAAGVGKGIGDRIRADAQLKRKELLAEKQTTETMKRQTHNSGLRREENTQQHGMTLDQQTAQNDDARGRIELTDELGQENYQDVNDESGNIIGQRETDSNRYEPYATDSAGSDLSDLGKLRIETLNSEIEAIYKSTADLGGVMSPEDEDRLGVLTLNRNALLYGSKLSDYTGEGSGDPAAGGEASADPAGTSEPNSFEEDVQQEVDRRDAKGKDRDLGKKIEKIQDDAEKALKSLTPRPKSGPMGRPVGGANQNRVSPETVAEARDTLARLYRATADEKTYNAMSDRAKTQLKSTVLKLEAKLREQGNNAPPPEAPSNEGNPDQEATPPGNGLTSSEMNYNPSKSDIYPQANASEQISLNRGLLQRRFPDQYGEG